MRRQHRALAALAMVAVLSAGCSGGSSAGAGIGTGAGSSGTGAAAARSKAVRFAECMRDNGVSEFPDPDASGALTIDGALNGSSLDPRTAEWKKAISACKDLEPPGFTGHRRSVREQESALKFAACMRENGVTDFPDPTEDGPLIDTSRIPSAGGRGARSIPGFQAAMNRCTGIYSGELGLKRR